MWLSCNIVKMCSILVYDFSYIRFKLVVGHSDVGGCSVFAVLLSKLVPLCGILFHENTFATLFEVWGWPSCNLHKIIKWLNDEEYVKRRLLIRMKNWYSKPSHQFKLRQVSDEMVRGFLKRWMSYLRVFSNLLCIIKT